MRNRLVILPDLKEVILVKYLLTQESASKESFCGYR